MTSITKTIDEYIKQFSLNPSFDPLIRELRMVRDRDAFDSTLKSIIDPLRSIVGGTLVEPVIVGIIGGGTSFLLELVGISSSSTKYGPLVVAGGLATATYVLQNFEIYTPTTERVYIYPASGYGQGMLDKETTDERIYRERLTKDLGLGFLITAGISIGAERAIQPKFLANIGLSTIVATLAHRYIKHPYRLDAINANNMPDKWIGGGSGRVIMGD
jgi:hypothetical protein